MKEKIVRFMQGRYGIDQFSRFLLYVSFALLLISMFFPIRSASLPGLLLMCYCYFRMFSKNIPARYKENAAFLRLRSKWITKWQKTKREMQQRKTHRIYKCPKCKQKIRVPRGRGKIAIYCPKCNTEFIRKS